MVVATAKHSNVQRPYPPKSGINLTTLGSDQIFAARPPARFHLLASTFRPEDDLRSFNTNGFCTFRGFVKPEHLEQLRMAFDRWSSLQSAEQAGLAADPVLAKMHYGWEGASAMALLQVLRDERLLEAIEPLVGVPFAVCRVELLGVWGNSDHGECRRRDGIWHQDPSSMHAGFRFDANNAHVRPHPLTLCIALDDITAQSGCMLVMPGRHHEVLSENGDSDSGDVSMAQLRAGGSRMVLEYSFWAGQAGLHHPLVPHRWDVISDPARASSWRGFLLRLAPVSCPKLAATVGTAADVRRRGRQKGWSTWLSGPEGRYLWHQASDHNCSELRPTGDGIEHLSPLVCYRLQDDTVVSISDGLPATRH
eukprot:gnl/TRDRNA2_/TRDRNA2_175045_c1_seq1.p1 gnl/TRDRNA2_/TRDRNA2_175045_c1~~gnl/TRDRNA2_/TRDRNA2_175045_c1_seq1.p1  ORF type:complete len:387 (-),score=42.18 gnl/TRDRNA2_/TRDRNA2_175045_c1_seq1:102-1196(-)